MPNKSSSVIPVAQIEKFIREFYFFNREINALRHHYVTTGISGNLVSIRGHLERLFSRGGPPKQAESIDLFYNFCLALSDRQNALTMGELSSALQVPLSTATRIVDWLVEGECVKRFNDPRDRRVVKVTLTDTGREIYGLLNECITQQAIRILGHFTSEERKQLTTLLHKFTRVVTEEKSRLLDGVKEDLR